MNINKDWRRQELERLASQAELVDIVDADGNPTGQVQTKGHAHTHGLNHRDVHVWITNGRDLLEQQRHPDKTIMPGEWDISVSEHVMAGESYRNAAVRGAAEELGLHLPPKRFLPAGQLAVEMQMETATSHPWVHHTVGDNFVVIEPGLQIRDLTLQETEVVDARWYPIDQLEADLRNPETATIHASQPPELWALGITAMRQAILALELAEGMECHA
jgi:isopentenyl-diphosphate Delta-isomerase